MPKPEMGRGQGTGACGEGGQAAEKSAAKKTMRRKSASGAEQRCRLRVGMCPQATAGTRPLAQLPHAPELLRHTQRFTPSGMTKETAPASCSTRNGLGRLIG
ncbi:hypothetical protein [Streptomyces sp. NPDC046332]|uniref:hypothetical protein n=1 Tax=Streptomyces sp. NPDC046332 TaxID=3155133 RepID=UPI0033F1DA9E